MSATILDEFEPCPTPDCQWGICRWGGTGYCYPCSERMVGRAEMDRRYEATRVSATDRRWNGKAAV